MKLSAFNIYSAGFPEAGQTLVHNTLADSTVVLGDDVLAALQAMSAADGPLPPLEGADDLTSQEVGVVVRDLAEEEKAWHRWIDAFRTGGDALSALVCVSYACNMACPYCCQEEIMSGQQMKPETAERVADFLARRFVEGGYRAIDLYFIGGEPLVNLPAIVTIGRTLRDLARSAGARWKMGLLTNGALLDEAREEALVEAGLTQAQITVDGDRETHNLSRPLKRGGDSFGAVWENVKRLSRRLPVHLVGNFTAESAPSFRKLVARMQAEGLTREQLRHVRFKPVLAGLAAPPGQTPEACTWSGTGSELILAVHDMVRDAGYSSGGPLDRGGPCAFYDVGHVTLGPGGEIYKCPGFLGQKGWECGDVDSGFSERWQRMTSARPYRACGSCAHRPECAGGCIATEWLKNGRMEGVNCEKEMLETVGLIELQRLVRGARESTAGRLEELSAKYSGRPAAQTSCGSAPRDEGFIAPRTLVKRAMESAA